MAQNAVALVKVKPRLEPFTDQHLREPLCIRWRESVIRNVCHIVPLRFSHLCACARRSSPTFRRKDVALKIVLRLVRETEFEERNTLQVTDLDLNALLLKEFSYRSGFRSLTWFNLPTRTIEAPCDVP